MHSDPSSSEQFSSMESLKIDKFTYHGWQQDYHAIIQSQAEDEYFGVALRFGESNSVTRDRFLGMIHSQRLANGDRSHSQIALLDSIKASLTYPGHQKDIDHAERCVNANRNDVVLAVSNCTLTYHSCLADCMFDFLLFFKIR